MTLSVSSLAITGFGLLATVNAHMVITNPVPFDSAALLNGPLAADGSDYPCKFGAGYAATITTMNEMSVGESNNLTFMGSATHGGGSCQLSITTDPVPTKDSKFKVIYSIIGGCPLETAGNIGDDASFTGAPLSTFNFKLPKSVPNGKATLAWSWLNKIGNREFYMNCAPITVSGGSSDSSAFDKLPDMMVANIAVDGQTCSTPESFEMVYPDPGESVTTAGTGPFSTATCNGGSGGTATAPTGATGSDATAAASSAQPTAAAPSSNPGGVFAPGAASASTPAAAAPTTIATSAATAAPVPAATPSSAPEGTSSGSCTTGQVSCTASGFYCIDADTFGLCASGCATPMKVAQGTACGNNAISYAVAPKPAGMKKRETSKFARRFPPHARRAAAAAAHAA